MTETAVLMGHGTRDADGAAQFVELLGAVRGAAPGQRVEAGFLEFGGPVLPALQEVFDRCVAEGAARIRAVPILLHDAGHTNNDMPREVATAQARHPNVRIEMTEPLMVCDALYEVVEDRIVDLERVSAARPHEETSVLLVGRGTSDPGANGDFFKIGRLLWERNRFAMVECAFVSLTEPTVPMGIDRCARLGARRLLVIPYFLHTGVLVKRIAQQAAATAAGHPGLDVAVGEPMGVHPNLVRLILDRIRNPKDETTDGLEDPRGALRASAG
jgi:sirohydrochlorin cobaltochelatase